MIPRGQWRKRRRRWWGPRTDAPTQRMSFEDFTLVEALDTGQCVLCSTIPRTLAQYLKSLYHQSVADAPHRVKWRAAWGFCPRHMMDVIAAEDSLGKTALMKDLVTTLMTTPAGTRAPREPCPACVVEEDAYAKYLDLIDQWAQQNHPPPPLPLCWPHLRTVMSAKRGVTAKTRGLFWAAHRAQWAAWAISLQKSVHGCPPSSAWWRDVQRYFAGEIALPKRPSLD